MKIYTIAGKQYAVLGEELYEKLSDISSPTIEASPEFPERRKYNKTPKNRAIAKTGRGKVHCKTCGEYGHFAKTCPQRDGGLPPDEVQTRPEITKQQVDELRAKGLDSLRIAAKLKTTLSEVNKHW